MTRPLQGIRVIDLSRVLAGPWATQLLADLGAEVIKIEKPGVGDDTRSWGPPYARADSNHDDRSSVQGRAEAAYFLGANRGKKSLCIDLKSAEGGEIVRELVRNADVLVENFKVGDLQRYGLDAETLTALNPALIYCSITGFGQSGPKAGKAGYDLMIQGMAGLMSITGQPEDEPGAGPTKVGVAVVDILTGLYAVIGILAALREREQDDRAGGKYKGCHIDLALYDVCVASMANQTMNWLIGRKVPTRLGNRHPNIVPYQTYKVRDGHIILAVGNDLQFHRFCQAIKMPELATSAKFATNSARVANREELNHLIEPMFKQRSRQEWLELLEPESIPCGPINSIAEALADPHAQARGIVRTLDHARLGATPGVANPIHFNGESVTSTQAPPTLGQDTISILRDTVGLSDEQIARLVELNIVQGEKTGN